MAYMMVETSVRTHRKFLDAGPEASWLWLCGLGYCQEGLTDGFIPETAIDYLGVKRPRTLAHKLVSARLWEVVSGGWRMHDYLEHNKPAEEVREIMRKRKAGGALGGRPRKSEKNLEGSENENLPENPLLTTCTDGTTKTEESVSSAPPAATEPPDPAIAIFPIVGKGGPEWPLRQDRVDSWTELYPTVDVLAEIRKALAWISVNPGRRKTASGMPRFLVNWLNRATDRGGGRQSSAEQPFTQRELEAAQSWLRSVRYCPHDPTCGDTTTCKARYIRERLRLQRAS